MESTEIEATDEDGDFTPYDRRDIPGEGGACTKALHYFVHEGTFTFETPGTKTIRFHGRRFAGDLIDKDRYELFEIHRQVTVQ